MEGPATEAAAADLEVFVDVVAALVGDADTAGPAAFGLTMGVVCCVNATDVDPDDIGFEVVGRAVDAAVEVDGTVLLVGDAHLTGEEATVVATGLAGAGFAAAVTGAGGFVVAFAVVDVLTEPGFAAAGEALEAVIVGFEGVEPTAFEAGL